MHPSRRRKKRPNYGIRTVEVIRGPNGFGFTISGQQPCILSCIVSKSPADQAGLRAGDFLISVNGMSVSKSTHDSVVNLIGSSIGPIQMTIAENYYSDSSDEDMGLNRTVNNRKPKYMHKPRINRNYKHEAGGSSTDRLGFNSPIKKVMRLQNPVNKNIRKQLENDVASNQENNCNLVTENQGGPIEYKALVGYLGTIEMPKQLMPSARLRTVSSCIRKLRQEKRTPTTVLMTILPTCLTLKNASNQILAIYPTSRVVYISSSTDKDARYFGLVTSAICDNRNTESIQNRISHQYSNIEKSTNDQQEKLEIEISNSCHIFVTDFKSLEHNVHLEKADHFKITCTQDVITGSCLEFPKNALYIVSLVQNMYKLQDSTTDHTNRNSHLRQNQEENLNHFMANSPQPSASSNSDSGIGFRDDCGNISDRILVVEFPAPEHIPIVASNSNNKRPSGIAISNSLLENLDMSLDSSSNMQLESSPDINNIRSKSFELKSPQNSSQRENNFEDEESKYYSNLNNIRACEGFNKNYFEKTPASADNHVNKKLFNVDLEKNDQADYMNRLAVRAMPNLQDTRKCLDTSTDEVFSERAIDVPDIIISKKSFESVSMHSANEDISDFKSSVSNLSTHSSKSLEHHKTKHIFKTPNMAKYFENKKSTKRSLKVVGSYDNLVDKGSSSLFNYKLSPKVYGLSKPNHSCEELNFLDNGEKCGFGSLQDLCSLVNQGSRKRDIAQSEPDVRITRLQQESMCLCEENGVPSSKQAEAAATWTSSFEKLLEDPVGLQAFAEFLKKEFSAENIYFWTACERFRRLSSVSERIREARRIYQKHLCVGAVEPVNVDSQARQCTEQSLQEADYSLFEQAQKQIFNLMKFDSYPRFLKSDLYKQCLSGHLQICFDSSLSLQPSGGVPTKLKKSLSNAEDRRRKSLLPWHRKSRSKSKDRNESDGVQKNDDSIENSGIEKNDVHSSKSSLTSLESSKGFPEDFSSSSAAARGPLCRVILCNGSTTVVQIKQAETIEELVHRVLDKRGISYSSFEVYTDKHPKALGISESSTALAGCEVKIEQRVIFKLDLPNRKIIAVKSKYTKIIIDVLKPILNKYNYRLEDVKVTTEAMEFVDISQPVTSIDRMRLHVYLCEDFKEPDAVDHQRSNNVKVFNSTSLDELTNKVFKELLHEKADKKTKLASDRGSVKSEDWGSENSSGILGRFLRRDSGIHEKKKKCLALRVKENNSNHSSVEDVSAEQSMITVKKPLIAKWKSGVNKLHVGCSENEKLYEGLNRAQNSRIEDQRGTEINFELPDFLKDKENADRKCQRGRKLKRIEDTDEDASSHVTNTKLAIQSNYENRHVIVPKGHNTSVNNNNLGHFNQNQLRIYSPNKLPSDDSSVVSPSLSQCSAQSNNVDNLKNSEPPPLPPKPKILPMKPSNWGQNGLFKVPRIPRSDTSKQNLYLEQPTSSFV